MCGLTIAAYDVGSIGLKVVRAAVVGWAMARSKAHGAAGNKKSQRRIAGPGLGGWLGCS